MAQRTGNPIYSVDGTLLADMSETRTGQDDGTGPLLSAVSGRAARVTTSIGAIGAANQSVVLDWCQRHLFALAGTPTRWRLKIRNYNARTGSANASANPITVNAFLGVPAYPSLGTYPPGRFIGVLAAAPTQVLSGVTLPTDGGEYVSGWLTTPIKARQPYVLSLGLNSAGQSVPVSLDLGVALFANAGGSAAAAGSQAFTLAGWAGYLDVRVEYETVSPRPVLLTIGDSITQGFTAQSTQNAEVFANYEGWAGAAAMAEGALLVNLGIGATSLLDWAPLPVTNVRYTRADLSVSPPDFILIALGYNDIAASQTLVQMQTNLLTLLATLRAAWPNAVIGAANVFPCPSVLTTAQDSVRTQWNAWLGEMPNGLQFIADFDQQMKLQAAANPVGADTDLSPVTGAPHPTLRGHQKLAKAVHFADLSAY